MVTINYDLVKKIKKHRRFLKLYNRAMLTKEKNKDFYIKIDKACDNIFSEIDIGNIIISSKVSAITSLVILVFLINKVCLKHIAREQIPIVIMTEGKAILAILGGVVTINLGLSFITLTSNIVKKKVEKAIVATQGKTAHPTFKLDLTNPHSEIMVTKKKIKFQKDHQKIKTPIIEKHLYCRVFDDKSAKRKYAEVIQEHNLGVKKYKLTFNGVYDTLEECIDTQKVKKLS